MLADHEEMCLKDKTSYRGLPPRGLGDFQACSRDTAGVLQLNIYPTILETMKLYLWIELKAYHTSD